MKKFFYILAAAALAVTAASCQKEVIPASDGPEVSATFSVALPGNFTKAISDGQTVDQLVFGVYSGGEEIAALRQNDVAVTAGKATVTVQLVKGQTYTFAFWAQKSGTGYYDTANLSAVTVNYEGKANDESRDAFYACKADYTVTGPFTETIVLKRPFAQINVGTSDATAAAAAGIVVEKSAMTVSGAGNTLNLLTGAVSGSETVTYTYTVNAIPTETLKVKSGDAAIDAIDYQWLAMNYILVGKAKKSLVDVTATLTFANGKGTLPLEIPNAPVQGNYRTNIIGALLTSQGTFNVIVDEKYDGPDYVYNPLLLAAKNGGSVTLTEDVYLADLGLNFLAINGVDVVIDLNGHKIVPNPLSNTTIRACGGAHLTINGKGEVGSLELKPGTTDDGALAISVDGADVVLNGGTYYGGPECSCIYLYKNVEMPGSITINGGYYKVAAPWNNWYYVLNLQNGATGKITVNGGKFENYNPANGDDHDQPTDFVADGHSSVLAGSDPVVYEVVENLTVTDKAAFQTALDAGTPAIELTADIDGFDSPILLGNSLTIVGNGHSIKNSANRVMRVTQPNLTLTFENVKLVSTCTATSDVRCLSFDDISSGSKVLIDGCELSASFYCINFGVGSEGHEITLRNATVASGWAAINCYANNSVFKIENSTLRGMNDKAEGPSNDYATIVFDGGSLYELNIGVNGSGNTVNITKSTIYASSESSNNQAWLSVQYGAKRDTINVDADTRIIDDNGKDQTGNMIFDNIVGYVPSTSMAESYDPASKVFIADVDRTPSAKYPLE